MRYELDLTKFNDRKKFADAAISANDIWAIHDLLLNYNSTVDEACAAQAFHLSYINFNDEEYDAYADEKLAAKLYKELFIKDVVEYDRANTLVNLLNNQHPDVKYLRDDVDADYGEVKVLAFVGHAFTVYVGGENEDDVTIVVNELTTA